MAWSTSPACNAINLAAIAAPPECPARTMRFAAYRLRSERIAAAMVSILGAS